MTDRVNENKFIVVDDIKFEAPKTKDFVKMMNNLNVSKALVVLKDNDVNAVMSAKNIPTVKNCFN